jgi:hypothetical protein
MAEMTSGEILATAGRDPLLTCCAHLLGQKRAGLPVTSYSLHLQFPHFCYICFNLELSQKACMSRYTARVTWVVQTAKLYASATVDTKCNNSYSPLHAYLRCV